MSVLISFTNWLLTVIDSIRRLPGDLFSFWFAVLTAAGVIVVALILGILLGGRQPAQLDPALPAYDEPGEKLLQSTVDFVKVTAGAAVAALAFGVGFVANAPVLPFWVRVFALVSGMLLATSVAFGFVAQSGLLGKIESHQYSLQDYSWTVPGIAHLVTLAAAVFFLAFMLYQLLWEEPVSQSYQRPSAARAIEAVYANRKMWLHPKEDVVKVTTTEFIKGVDPAKGTLGTWHIQIEIKPRPPPALRTKRGAAPLKSSTSESAHRFVDFFVDPFSGSATSIP